MIYEKENYHIKCWEILNKISSCYGNNKSVVHWIVVCFFLIDIIGRNWFNWQTYIKKFAFTLRSHRFRFENCLFFSLLNVSLCLNVFTGRLLNDMIMRLLYDHIDLHFENCLFSCVLFFFLIKRIAYHNIWFFLLVSV